MVFDYERGCHVQVRGRDVFFSRGDEKIFTEVLKDAFPEIYFHIYTPSLQSAVGLHDERRSCVYIGFIPLEERQKMLDAGHDLPLIICFERVFGFERFQRVPFKELGRCMRRPGMAHFCINNDADDLEGKRRVEKVLRLVDKVCTRDVTVEDLRTGEILDEERQYYRVGPDALRIFQDTPDLYLDFWYQPENDIFRGKRPIPKKPSRKQGRGKDGERGHEPPESPEPPEPPEPPKSDKTGGKPPQEGHGIPTELFPEPKERQALLDSFPQDDPLVQWMIQQSNLGDKEIQPDVDYVILSFHRQSQEYDIHGGNNGKDDG